MISGKLTRISAKLRTMKDEWNFYMTTPGEFIVDRFGMEASLRGKYHHDFKRSSPMMC